MRALLVHRNRYSLVISLVAPSDAETLEAGAATLHAHAVHPTRVRLLPPPLGGAVCSAHLVAVRTSGGMRSFPSYSCSTSGMLGG